MLSARDIESAQRFKRMHASYEATRRELGNTPDPPTAMVEKFMALHRKLEMHKAGLWKLAKGAQGV